MVVEVDWLRGGDSKVLQRQRKVCTTFRMARQLRRNYGYDTLKLHALAGLADDPEPQSWQLGSISLLDAEVTSLQQAESISFEGFAAAAQLKATRQEAGWLDLEQEYDLTCKGGPSQRLSDLQSSMQTLFQYPRVIEWKY